MYKKIIAGIMAFTMFCGAACVDNGIVSEIADIVSVSAEDLKLDNGLSYQLNEKGTEVIIRDCDNDVTKIEIPPEIDGLPVTTIDDQAFSGCQKLTSIVIPDSVENIYNYAFSSCKSLKEITIPDSVRVLGPGVFSYCTSLISVNINGRIESIYSDTFYKCSALTDVKIPDSVTVIEAAFVECTSLSDIIIPDSVRKFDKSAFTDTMILNNQTEDVKYAGKWIIDCNKDVTSVEIKPDTIGIVNGAFADCTSLTEIILPDSVESICDNAFKGCTSLTDITIPDSVKNIGYNAFSDTPFFNNQTTDIKYAGKWIIDCNTDVSSFEIKSDTIGFAHSAFAGCSSLTEIIIPYSVKNICDSAFSGCTSLTEITVPDSVAYIGDYAFSNTALKEINLPDSVTNISKYLFFSCASLAKVTIPNTVTSIGEGAFFDCTSLNKITIPDSVTSIRNYSLGYCADAWSKIKTEGFVINGVKGSAAEKYANDNEFEFVEIGNPSAEKTGDVDGDGEITSNDALNILQSVVGMSDLTDEQKKLADLDGDGDITSADALYILQIVVGLR